MEVDDAEKNLVAISEDVNANLPKIESEEDTKIQIVNRILHECLGWSYSDFRTEKHHENGYSDYILEDNEKPVVLIEAKRIGIIGVNTAEQNKIRYLKISGSSLRNAMAGISQAATYAAPNGIVIAVLTDGITWIVFKTFIPGEDFKTKEAIVFPSINAIINDFSVFFDLLSKQQFRKKIYNQIFDQIHHNRLLLSKSLVSPIEGSDIKITKKSELAFDLDIVFSGFFSKLIGDDDDELLIECFVETRESRIADFSLEKITTSVLGNLVPADKDVDQELANLIKDKVESSDTESGQTIFVVGPTGAGKTTFLDRFFRKTLPTAIRQKCVLVQVDCLDATGREETALKWITESLIATLENEVYPSGTPLWGDLLGLYHREYRRRSIGVDAELYKKDKQAFKIKFGEFLDERVESDREGYLKRILSDVVNNRKMLPIILIDNTDEFTLSYKQKIFQFSQSLRRHANHCLVIFPVTDKSAWSFSKTDMFGIYKSRSFFLPTPSPREIFRKRIDYLKRILSDNNHVKNSRGGYLLSKGIKISVKNLDGFAQVLENIFVSHDYTSKTIGELTNYNIRRTLLLSQRVITSPVLKIEELISSYLSGSMVATNFIKFMDALLKGDYDAYKPEDNPEIFPIFQVDREVRQSPLLQLRILTLLHTAHLSNRSIEKRHLAIQSIIDYFDSIGCPETATDKALVSLLEAGLIEPYDASNQDLSSTQKFAISYRGIAHLRLATYNNAFFYQMALTTPIADEDIAAKIRSIYKSDESFQAKLNATKELFSEYLITEDRLHLSVDSELEQYICQSELIDNIRRFSRSGDHNDEIAATFGEDYRQGVIKEGVVAVVECYDISKGFGFVDVDGYGDRIFLHSSKLKEFGVDQIANGDKLLCDLSRGDRGFYIANIQDVEVNAGEVCDCRIVRYFSDRGYGFVKIMSSPKTAFFHKTVFPEEVRSSILEGQQLKAEICADQNGEGFTVKRILKNT